MSAAGPLQGEERSGGMLERGCHVSNVQRQRRKSRLVDISVEAQASSSLRELCGTQRICVRFVIVLRGAGMRELKRLSKGWRVPALRTVKVKMPLLFDS
jgi:hypothetical protein